MRARGQHERFTWFIRAAGNSTDAPGVTRESRLVGAPFIEQIVYRQEALASGQHQLRTTRQPVHREDPAMAVVLAREFPLDDNPSRAARTVQQHPAHVGGHSQGATGERPSPVPLVDALHRAVSHSAMKAADGGPVGVLAIQLLQTRPQRHCARRLTGGTKPRSLVSGRALPLGFRAGDI